jgi:hypothetical protein
LRRAITVGEGVVDDDGGGAGLGRQRRSGQQKEQQLTAIREHVARFKKKEPARQVERGRAGPELDRDYGPEFD